jgi:AraC-like DNA-binding protein
MEQFAIFFGTASAFVILSLTGILLFVNKEPSLSKNLLVLVLVTLSTTALAGVGFYSGFFLKYPFLFRLNSPLTLIVLPALFVYTRSVLTGETCFRKYDWFLLIPSVLQMVNLIPYWELSHESKRMLIEQQHHSAQLQTTVDEGFLPAYVFPSFRAIWSLFFIVLNYRLIVTFRKKTPQGILQKNKDLLKWLGVLNSLFALLVVIVIFTAVLAPLKKTGGISNDFGVGIIGLIICIQLLVRPGLLYGLYYPLPPRITPINLFVENTQEIEKDTINKEVYSSTVADDVPVTSQLASKNSISLEDNYRYKKIIETLFVEKKVFLKTEYSLDDLVRDAGIPRYTISSFINREYNTGFREFLNTYRVEYFKEHFNNPEFSNLTLEAIASKCGFYSRSTFISNFKKNTGKTPSEYITAIRTKDEKSDPTSVA